MAPNAFRRSQLLLLLLHLFQLSLFLLLQLLSELLRNVLLKILICIKCLEVDNVWNFLNRPILIYEKFEVCVRTNELSLFLHKLSLGGDFGS